MDYIENIILPHGEGKKTIVAMSGGVDSSVAAYLMKLYDFDCTGVTMKLFGNQDIGVGKEKRCCSLDDAEDAENVAHRLGIPHYVFNFTEDFKQNVIQRFTEAYHNGATPNPCIDCNRYIKFEKLLLRAKQLDIDYIATGHYARIDYDSVSGRYLLKKAADPKKDQSYVLYSLTQEQLKHTLLPLGGLYKSQVREIASEQGFINAKKHDSQDICFVINGSYAEFIEQYTGKTYDSGNFIAKDGSVLGKHKGLIHYTVGQRKGLGMSFPKPMYVCSKCAADNTVTLCEKEGLYSKSLNATDFNWIAYDNPDAPVRVKAKIRYNQIEQWATAIPTSDNTTVHIEFDETQRAITPGQAVVLYDGDIVVGGGTIV